MRMMNLNGSNKKKVRGVKRKCKSFIKSIEELTEVFPEIEIDRGYWHLHLPVKQEFIDSKKTPSTVRKICIQTLIDRVQHLVEIKPNLDIRIRVIACIEIPCLWNSQIIIFFGDDYFKNFFNRNDQYQIWTPLPTKRNLQNELNLKMPVKLNVKGYSEKIKEEDYETSSELWFVGELS